MKSTVSIIEQFIIIFIILLWLQCIHTQKFSLELHSFSFTLNVIHSSFTVNCWYYHHTLCNYVIQNSFMSQQATIFFCLLNCKFHKDDKRFYIRKFFSSVPLPQKKEQKKIERNNNEWHCFSFQANIFKFESVIKFLIKKKKSIIKS